MKHLYLKVTKDHQWIVQNRLSTQPMLPASENKGHSYLSWPASSAYTRLLWDLCVELGPDSGVRALTSK